MTEVNKSETTEEVEEVVLTEKEESKLDKIVEKKIKAILKDQEKEFKSRMKKLDDEIEEKVAKRTNEINDKLLRNQAELENFKRRSKEELSRYLKYSSQDIATKLIDVVDNFERALAQPADDEATKNYQKGFELIFNSFIKVLEDEEVKVIETVGLEFDPNIHQAVMQDSNPDFESGVVTEEFQKGYILKDRVLRASMVKVNE